MIKNIISIFVFTLLIISVPFVVLFACLFQIANEYDKDVWANRLAIWLMKKFP